MVELLELLVFRLETSYYRAVSNFAQHLIGFFHIVMQVALFQQHPFNRVADFAEKAKHEVSVELRCFPQNGSFCANQANATDQKLPLTTIITFLLSPIGTPVFLEDYQFSNQFINSH